MDHRVSKDMISSGMTPSGEKTQADLGKTQYGSAPSPNRLMDAYYSMYQNQKEETLNEKMGDMADFASRNIKGARGAAKAPTPPAAKAPNPKTEVFGGNVVNSKTGEPIRKASMIDKVRDRRGKIEDKEGITARREKVQKTYDKAREQGLTDGVDLLAAYQSIYADTFEEGKIPAGLQAYLDKKKGKKKDDDNGDEEKEGKKKDKKDVKEGAGLYANIHAKRKRGGKMRKKGAKGAPSAKDFANAARTAKEDVDLFDLVSSKLIEEGYSEKESYEIMSNLTEEQLNEILGIGAALGAAGKFVTGLGAKAAATGAGKILANTAAKKGIGAAAKKGTMMIGKKLGGTQGAKIGARAADAFGKMDNFSKVQVGGMALNTAGNIAQAPVNLVKGMGGGSQQQASNTISKTGRRKSVTASADLFDIVKGQLLDEGLSEEEIRDIMLELTPEEILAEMNQGPSTPVSIDKVEFPKPGKKVMPKTGATYIGKVRPKPGFKMNPASGEVEKEEYQNVDEMTGLSPEFLTKAAILANKKRGKAAVAGNQELAIKRMKQAEKFSAAAREKKGKPDYSKPYTNTSNEKL